jgi:predicted nuclease of predicted toxin-antitoxin system
MKLLLEENLPRRLVPEIEASFPGSSHVVLLGLEAASDAAIWQR